MDEDSPWLCTQAIVDDNDRSDDEKEKVNNFGCIVLNGIVDNVRYVLRSGENTIGRHPSNDLFIEHPSVSMNHAVIQCDSDGVVLLDKGSLNKTKLNKKNLKKGVAYFLDENALLLFGEVQANYFVDVELSETNETKTNVSKEMSTQKVTANDCKKNSFLPKLSSTVITSNSSIDKELIYDEMEIIVPKIIRSECTENTLIDKHLKLNSPSSSDEFLLDAVSQIETVEGNVNSSEEVYYKSREYTPSPVIDLTEPTSMIPDKYCSNFSKNSLVKKDNQIESNLQELSNSDIPKIMRDDTPSPVMDLENFLSGSFSTVKKSQINPLQSPDKINSRVVREDTPSPVMDLGLFSDSENRLYSVETSNHDILSPSGPRSNVDESNETQLLEVDVNILESSTQKLPISSVSIKNITTQISTSQSYLINQLGTNEPNPLDELTQPPITDHNNYVLQKPYFDGKKCDERNGEFQPKDDEFFNCPTQNVIPQILSSTDKPKLFQLKTSLISYKTETRNNEFNEMETQMIDKDNNFYECPTQKISTFKSCSNYSIGTSLSLHQKQNKSKSNLNIFEVDDDDLFVCIDQQVETGKQSKILSTNVCNISDAENEKKTIKCTNSNDKDKQQNDDSYNSPIKDLTTSTFSQSKIKSDHKNQNMFKKNTFEADDDDMFSCFIQQESKFQPNDSNPIDDDDFFNCPTQKVLISKKLNSNSTLSSKRQNEDTQKILELGNTNKITSKLCVSSIHEELTQVPGVDEDIFNCPTQKISTSRNLNTKSSIPFTKHEEETQKISELGDISKSTLKTCITSNHEDLTQVSEIDDDFFNCPTQKLSISRKSNTVSKCSSTINEEKTQKLSKLVDTSNIISMTNITGLHEDSTQVPHDVEDEDFFNCPTQKVSISRKINSTAKLFSKIHEDETQELPKYPQSHKVYSKNSNISAAKINDKLTQIATNNDDFFNAPTQKVPTSRQCKFSASVTSTIHNEETQSLSEHFNENRFTSNTGNTKKHEDLTQIPLLDGDDFFNCPTQNISICRNVNTNSSIPSTIHKKKTLKLSVLDDTSKSTTKTCVTSIHDDITRVPEEDNDFFNCPTQKVSVFRKLNSTARVSSTMHEEETQYLTEKGDTKKNTSKTCITTIHEDLIRVPEVDEDFFNCPTQKISTSRNLNTKSSIPFTIHEEETQKLSEFGDMSKSTLKTCITSNHEDLTHLPKEDEDFFNCPTQKISTSRNLNAKSRIPFTKHEEETQKLIEFGDMSKSTLKTCITSNHEDLTHIPKEDEDFFNCPTQKISTSRNLNTKSSIPFTKHEEETQKLTEFGDMSKSTLKTCITSNHEDLTHVPKEDEDFFNCPTQKISTFRNLNAKSSIPFTKHAEETQKLSEFGDMSKSTLKTCITSNHEDLTHVPKEDEDFFNCPTQKISTSRNLNTKSSIPFTKHEEETQKLTEFGDMSKSTLKTCITSNHEDLTHVPKEDEDFFNCPTQKISTFRNLNAKSSIPFTKHAEETQKLSEFGDMSKSTLKTCITSNHEDLTHVPKEDEDFFNCPTQKISTSRNLNTKSSIPFTKHAEETQKLSEFGDMSKSTLKTCITSDHEDLTHVPKEDEDFFNCPTQKISTFRNLNAKSSIPFTKHAEETQKLSEFGDMSKSSLKTCITSNHEDLTHIPKEDEDFFNCPTQKISTSRNLNTKHEEETQKLSELGDMSINEDLTQVPEVVGVNDFFNCQTQKLSSNVKIKLSTNKQHTLNLDINEAETEILSMNSSSCNPPSKKRQDKENIFDRQARKVQTKIQSFAVSNKSLKKNNDETQGPELDANGIPLVYSNNINKKNIQKTILINSNANDTLSDSCNKNKKLSKNSKNNMNPIKRVREDLRTPCSISSSSKSLYSTNKIINYSPNYSKTITEGVNNQNMVSVKQEPLTDDSVECQAFNSLNCSKYQSERNNESVFSPLNVPNVITNSSLEQQSTPIGAEDSSNSKPSTSSNVASSWQLFWNKKKMANQNKSNRDKRENSINTNVVLTKEERYQTRAITKRENTEDSRKRKQDSVSVEDSNKRTCNEDRKNLLSPLVKNTSDVVVTFSYLRNRHLQEMKEFVNKTGGSITDEITECTVLVTDKIRCTMKILSAIAKGCPIVNANWLKHSYTVKMFQEMDDFIIVDKDAERKYKFRLKESLAKARANRLLEGYTVLVTPSVKPGPKDMKVIITCAGGNYVMSWPKIQVQNELIVTCDHDRHRWKSMWNNEKAKTINSDTLVMSIIRQKLII